MSYDPRRAEIRCHVCNRPIATRMWKHAIRKPGQAWETLRCLCGAELTREVRT